MDCCSNQTICVTYLGTNKNKRDKGLEFCKVNLYLKKQNLPVLIAECQRRLGFFESPLFNCWNYVIVKSYSCY